LGGKKKGGKRRKKKRAKQSEQGKWENNKRKTHAPSYLVLEAGRGQVVVVGNKKKWGSPNWSGHKVKRLGGRTIMEQEVVDVRKTEEPVRRLKTVWRVL